MGSSDAVDTGSHADWLATALRTSHVAVGISSLASGLFVEANEAFGRLFHLSREQIIGHSSAELGLWPDAQQRERLLELLQRQGSVSRFEARYRNSLGEVGDLEISARIVHQGDEPFLIGFLTDVTDRRELIEGLQAAQSRLGVILRASQMLVFRQDLELRYTWVANPALGATEADLIGRTDDDIMGAEAAAPLVDIKRRVLRSGQAERRDVWVAHNGQLGCFDLVVEPEHDAAGRLLGIVCAAQDITWRMTAQRRVASMPGTAIQGMASLIGREPLTHRQAERLQRIDHTAWRLVGRGSPAQTLARLRERHAGTLVLVAEQSPVLCEQLGALLEEAGLRVALAGSGVEAFSLTMQLKPALLLIDMELPQSGGVAAARAVRTMASHAPPIVAMLSPATPDHAARALAADLDDVLDKPVLATALHDKVLAWLEVRT